jgi:hypothetical protein
MVKSAKPEKEELDAIISAFKVRVVAIVRWGYWVAERAGDWMCVCGGGGGGIGG